MQAFRIHSDFAPAGDQPEAIARLIEGIRDGEAGRKLNWLPGGLES